MWQTLNLKLPCLVFRTHIRCGLLRPEYCKLTAVLIATWPLLIWLCTLPAAFFSGILHCYHHFPRVSIPQSLSYYLGIACRDTVYITHFLGCSLLPILKCIWLKASRCMYAVPKYLAAFKFLHISCLITFTLGHLKRFRAWTKCI